MSDTNNTFRGQFDLSKQYYDKDSFSYNNYLYQVSIYPYPVGKIIQINDPDKSPYCTKKLEL